ncbi:amidohydrolase 2 [Mycena belliarum]|uniref:Amidohydrolase 2 n=1 Tax=Mycena belliarum TaxID=1033014 RepID=A0AAD6TS63_9AGAR|nr:amidohydrolase 2 [Mycena belliae]
MRYPQLQTACFQFPCIDNHAHPLLAEAHRDRFQFEGLISEAQGTALNDAIHTLACHRAAAQLAAVLRIQDPNWNSVTSARTRLPYADLCKLFMDRTVTGIQCLILDDGLGGVEDFAEGFAWHDQFTSSPTKRIVRVEIVAEAILKSISRQHADSDDASILKSFNAALHESLTNSANDENVVAFKSIACYRTGLNVSPSGSEDAILQCFQDVLKALEETGRIRLAHKALNDHIVRMALEVAGQHRKPVQFHCGLGDNDITLNLSSPSHLQAVIKAYHNTPFVLLHSSYPFTREAGYLSAVYLNVFLDFGEVFPFVSGEGQRSIIRQVLELCPTNKILWSTDGHWWPESFYLGTIQARQALYAVLSDVVASGELSEGAAVAVVQNALFHNSNKLYNLGLSPDLTIFKQK